MEEDQPKKKTPVATDESSHSNKTEKSKVGKLHHKLVESKSSPSPNSEHAIGKNKQATAINGTSATSELNDASEVQGNAIETEKTIGFSDPHIPIPTAKDEKISFTKEQKKLIKVLQREANKLEKSIKREIEIARQNKQIKKDIIGLTEKLIKFRSKKKIYDTIDGIKTLHKRLKRGELKYKKERNRIREHDKMIDKIRSEIPI